jgi:hypothetical protein
MTRVMSESLDRSLSLRERVTLRLHLLVCLRCVRYLQQIFMIRKVIRRAPALPVVEDSTTVLSSEARERIKQKLKRNL